MNPLQTLPASTSPKGSWNGIDTQKMLRGMLICGASALVTAGPMLLGMKYQWHGTDFTVEVYGAVNLLLIAARQLLSGPPS